MKIIKKVFRFIGKIPVYLYKFLISPLLPHTCRFYPSCSSYMIGSINEFGVFKGSLLGIKRILKCNPKNKKTGYDPVFINIKGDNKWLL